MISESLIIVLTFFLYWLYGERRQRLKKRIGHNVFRNIFEIARNIHFMLTDHHDLRIKGDLRILDQGAVLYSWHFGTWELMPRMLRKIGYRLGIIANRYDVKGRAFTRAIDRMLFNWRSQKGVRVFYREDSRRIVRFIRDRGIFALLVDGDHLYAKLPKAEKLARVCKVPLIPFAVYRERDRGVLDLNCDLDELIRTRPHDYLWFYRSRTESS